MKYELTIKKSAAKTLESLPAKIVKPLTSAILKLADVPWRL